MLDYDFNDRTMSHLSENSATTSSFSQSPSRVSDFGAPFRELSALVLLMVATVGAILAIQNSPGHGRYTLNIGAPREIFTSSFSPKLVQDKKAVQQERRLAYLGEQRMSHSQLMRRWQPYIAEASRKFGVPGAWIRAVIKMESGGRTMSAENKPITSPVGAIGLMQLMPATYNEMRADHRLGADPFDPHDNIMAGTAYLRWLHRKYGFPAMFAAYNDGPGNLEAQQAMRRSLPDETQNYITGIVAMLEAGSSASKSASGKGSRRNVSEAAAAAHATPRVQAQYG